MMTFDLQTFLKNKCTYSLIYGCAESLLLLGHCSSCGEPGATLQLPCLCFSLTWPLLLQSKAQQFWCTGLGGSTAYEILSVQGSNPCLLHWQVDSSLLSHQEVPANFFLNRDQNI